jgi:3-hydroxyacyl-CoA dehydrogenase
MADECGLDVVLVNLESLKRSTGEEWLEPKPVLRGMVARGELGVKSGRGVLSARQGVETQSDSF